PWRRRDDRVEGRPRQDCGLVPARGLDLTLGSADRRSPERLALREALPRSARLSAERHDTTAHATARAAPTRPKISSARARCSGVCAAEQLARSTQRSTGHPGGTIRLT